MPPIDSMNEKSDSVDFTVHKELLRKFGNAASLPILWRIWLFQYLPVILVTLFGCFFVQGLQLGISEDLMLFLWVGIGIVSFALVILSTTHYLVNKFSRIQYKKFNMCLVKDERIIDRMTYYDSLCWMGSFIWRNVTISFLYGVVSFGIEEYELISQSMMQHVDRSVQITSCFLALYWLLHQKKKGRLILLQPKKELHPI